MWLQNQGLPDSQFIALGNRRLAVDLAPDGTVVPAEQTGEPCLPALVVEQVAYGPQVGGGHLIMCDKSTTDKARTPAEKLRDGPIAVAVWRNESDKGPWFSVPSSKSYKQGEDWKQSDSFGKDDIPPLCKLGKTQQRFVKFRLHEVAPVLGVELEWSRLSPRYRQRLLGC